MIANRSKCPDPDAGRKKPRFFGAGFFVLQSYVPQRNRAITRALSERLVVISYASTNNKSTSMPRNTAIQAALSVPRLGTYLTATTPTHPHPAPASAQLLQSAISLYGWNATVSSAFLHPLHICEVVIRNAVSDALSQNFGANWPWNIGFVGSLPCQVGRFRPRNEVKTVARSVGNKANPSTGKVLAEMKFAFWEHLFTARYQPTIWNSQIQIVFPHAPTGMQPHQIRAAIHTRLVQIRALRNRIAHHEPIFNRNLHADLSQIEDIVSYRCTHTTDWLRQGQMVRFILGHRPI